MRSGTGKKNQTRRAFFSEVTASTALTALAMAQWGPQLAAIAQEKKGASKQSEGASKPSALAQRNHRQ
jgi:hypothetical protein